MWDLPGLGLEPVSPTLAGGFLTILNQKEVPLLSFDSQQLYFSSYVLLIYSLVFIFVLHCKWDFSIFM